MSNDAMMLGRLARARAAEPSAMTLVSRRYLEMADEMQMQMQCQGHVMENIEWKIYNVKYRIEIELGDGKVKAPRNHVGGEENNQGRRKNHCSPSSSIYLLYFCIYTCAEETLRSVVSCRRACAGCV